MPSWNLIHATILVVYNHSAIFALIACFFPYNDGCIYLLGGATVTYRFILPVWIIAIAFSIQVFSGSSHFTVKSDMKSEEVEFTRRCCDHCKPIWII